MRKTAKIIPAALAAVLALGPALSAFAAAEPTPKEEVVYINLTPAGDVDTVEVVNIFDLDQPGQIVDYGNYASVRSMTTTDPVFFDGQTVTMDAGAGRIYCEGSLPGAEIPWDVSVRYLLDGTERTAEQLAGSSGALQIRLTVRENLRCRGNFFDAYALQISLTLDGERCQNITAEGATVANVGADKQLNYTVLPGKGADVTVTAQVTDFAMDAIAINGIPLSLDVEVDDEALLDQVTDLIDAVTALDEGAGTLSDGASALQAGAGDALAGAGALYAGASSLRSGTSSLQSGGESVQSGALSVSTGASSVDEGAQSLSAGLAQLQAGLTTLNENSAQLTEGSAAILTALTDVQTAVDGAELTDEQLSLISGTLSSAQASVDTLIEQLALAVSAVEVLGMIHGSYVSQTERLSAAVTALDTPADPAVPPPDTSELWAVCYDLQAGNESFAATLQTLAGLSDTAGTLMTGLNALSEALTSLSGLVPQLPGALSTLRQGVDDLTAQYAALDAGIRDYTAGVAAACDGCGQLTAGAASLTEGTAALAEGAGTLYSGASSLAQGITDVYNAAGTLRDGAGALDTGIDSLAQGTAALAEGAGQVKEGTAALAEGTGGMDEAVQEKIDELLDGVTGGKVQPESFVSERNTSVKAVQFVIRTPAIEPPVQEEPEPEPERPSSFWDKLVALF